MAKSHLEESLARQLVAAKMPAFEREFRFYRNRRWRLDFAWPLFKIAIEVQGGLWVNGGHSRGSGVTKDLEKKQQALRMGWIIYEASGAMIESGQVIETLNILLKGNYETDTEADATLATSNKKRRKPKLQANN